jgi:hypothetical protein
LDAAIDAMVLAFDAIPRVVRDGAATIYLIALTSSREGVLLLLERATQLRASERKHT